MHKEESLPVKNGKQVLSFYATSLSLIPKHDNEIIIKLISPMNMKAIIFSKILAE